MMIYGTKMPTERGTLLVRSSGLYVQWNLELHSEYSEISYFFLYIRVLKAIMLFFFV